MNAKVGHTLIIQEFILFEFFFAMESRCPETLDSVSIKRLVVSLTDN